jgi:hypothetical protein
MHTRDAGQRADNESHRHFIQLLEQTSDILTANKAKDAAPSGKGKGKGVENAAAVAEDSAFTNKFSELAVDQPLSGRVRKKTASSSPAMSMTADSKAKSEKAARFILQDTNGEWIERLIFFFNYDLREIRLYIQRIWHRYKEGALDLVVSFRRCLLIATFS